MRRMSWALGFLLAAAPAAAGAQTAIQTCRQPDSFSGNLARSLLHAATDVSLETIVARDSLRIPTTADVEVVTDDSTCARAARSYSRAVSGAEGMMRTVYAIRVGKVYVVEDPDERNEGYYAGLVLDEEFNLLKRYVVREATGRLAYAHIADKIANLRLQQ
jgi:hypothetical protein